MTSVPDQLEKLVEMLKGGFITPEEFDAQKRALLDGTAADSPGGDGSDPAARREVGAYRILAFLGEGGMGAVYRARHRSDEMARRQGGDVAIKVMHAQYARNPEYRARFEREATLGMRLDHPSIARGHDLIVDGGELALVIQFVPGRPLSEVMGEAAGPLAWDSAVELLEPLLDAVEAAHRHGVIHRDLKPENILVSTTGAPVIIDFGIAKDVESAHTRTGTGMGTVEYMAPEQYTDAGSVDHRADVYSLGMVLYEMLAGRLPWEAETAAFEILEQKARKQLMSPAAFRPGIPPEIVAALSPALAAAPDERYGSVAELRGALRSAASRLGAAGASDPPPVAVAPSSAPPVPAAPMAATPPRARPAEPASPSSGRWMVWIAIALGCLLLPVIGLGIWALATRAPTPEPSSEISDAELDRIRARERDRIQGELDAQAERLAEDETAAAEPPAPARPVPEPPTSAESSPRPITDQELERIRARERDRIRAELEAQTERILAEERLQASPAPNSETQSEIDKVWAKVSPALEASRDDRGDSGVAPEETTAEDWAFLGQMALDGGSCTNAIPNFREAVELAPGNASYNYKLGLSYHRCGREDSAVKYLTKAAGSIPAAKVLLDEIALD